MGRDVPLVAGTLVSIGVFIWLAGPLLETQFGIEALLLAYAGLACAAGAVTYLLLRRVDDRLADVPDAEDTGDDPNVTIELDATDVEGELDQLREEY